MPGRLRARCDSLTVRLIAGLVTCVTLFGVESAFAQPPPHTLDLPLYEPERGQTQLPAYHPRKFVLELDPDGPRVGLVVPGTDARARTPLVPTATGLPRLDALNARHGVVALEPMFPGETIPPQGSALEDLTRYYVVHLPEGASLAAALADYAAYPGIVSAQPVAIQPVSYLPNDPLRGNQFQLGQASDRDSDVYEAWDVFQGDTTIVIAIVDTGVLYAHPDLGGNVAPYTVGNIWTNFAELNHVAGFDDDGNGFVDDFRGWDYVAAVTGQPGEDLSLADNDPADFVGHGTFCAGMASARTNNGVGIAGTAFKSKIMALRVGWMNNQGNGSVDMLWCAQAINYAANKGAKVINCSWSNNNLNGLGSAVANAVAQGITVCVAAGNDNTSSVAQNYLASRGDCVDVASVDVNDVRSTFSNYGSWIDVSAAGEDVYGTYSSAYTPVYATGSGTSFAAPFAAGAVALFQGYRRSLGKPFYSSGRMLLRLRDTGDDIDALNGFFAGSLGTRLNVHRLLTDPPASWTNVTGGSITTSPALCDVDGDGDEEVVIGTSDLKVVAVTGADGDTLAGWPVPVGAAVGTSPTVWDVDQDGKPEIVVGTTGGKVWALKGDGTSVPGWPVQLTGAIAGAVAVADLVPAPGLECAVATAESLVYVLDHTGAILPGWPQHTHGPVYAAPALHDLDGDSYAEIVVATYDSVLHVFNASGGAFPGWPVTLGGAMTSSPAIGDIDFDGQPDIIAGAYDDKVHALRKNGTALAGWPVTVAGDVRCSPALADVFGNDGQLEVIVAADGPTLYVIRGNGTFAPGWPQALGGNVAGGVVVGNVDTDANVEIVLGASDKNLYVFDTDGQPKPGWPRLLEGAMVGTPTLGDPDLDGQLEILVGDSTKRLRAIDMGPGSFNAAALPWPTFHRDPLRRGSVSTVAVGVSPITGGAGAPRLAFAASPNPARTAMRIALGRSPDNTSPGVGSVLEVRVYNVAGRLIRRLGGTTQSGLDAALVWDGADDGGRPAPAGLYFAQARWGELEAHARLVRLP